MQQIKVFGAEQQRFCSRDRDNSEELFELAKKDEFFANEEDEGEVDTNNCAIACVNISGKFAFDPVRRHHFLKRWCSPKKRREDGDILVNNSSEGGAKVLATPAIAVFLTRALIRAHG